MFFPKHPIKSKKIQDTKPCFQKIFKNNKAKYIGQIKNLLFYPKKCNNFSKITTLKYIIPILI